MNLGLEGKVVLVTGGAKGIGAAIARSFAKEGAIVSIVDRNPDVGNDLVEQIKQDNGQAFCIPTELTDEEACRNAVEKTIQTGGRLDVLVHNAGTNDGVGLNSPPSDFLESLRKNLFHVFALTHFALDKLVESKGTNQRRIESRGYRARRNLRICRLQGRHECLDQRMGSRPRGTGGSGQCGHSRGSHDPMYRRWLDSLEDPDATLRSIEENIPLGKRMTTDAEIADSVVFLSSARSSHTSGQIFYPDGGYVHFDRAYGKIKVD